MDRQPPKRLNREPRRPQSQLPRDQSRKAPLGYPIPLIRHPTFPLGSRQKEGYNQSHETAGNPHPRSWPGLVVLVPPRRQTGSFPLRGQPAPAGPGGPFAQSYLLSRCKAVSLRSSQQRRQATHRPGPRSHRRQPEAVGWQQILARPKAPELAIAASSQRGIPRKERSGQVGEKPQKKRLNRRPASPTFFGLRQGSSGVEQGTHKPLVGSSTLPPGTLFSLGSRKPTVFGQTKEKNLASSGKTDEIAPRN